MTRIRSNLLSLLFLGGAVIALAFAFTSHAGAAVPRADLRARGAQNDLTVVAGETVTFRGEITNLGPDTADNPVLVVDVSTYSNVTIVASPAGFACGSLGQVVTCHATSLVSGGRGVVTFTAVADPAPDGRPRAHVTVMSDTFDPVLSNNHALAQSTLP